MLSCCDCGHDGPGRGGSKGQEKSVYLWCQAIENSGKGGLKIAPYSAAGVDCIEGKQ